MPLSSNLNNYNGVKEKISSFQELSNSLLLMEWTSLLNLPIVQQQREYHSTWSCEKSEQYIVRTEFCWKGGSFAKASSTAHTMGFAFFFLILYISSVCVWLCSLKVSFCYTELMDVLYPLSLYQMLREAQQVCSQIMSCLLQILSWIALAFKARDGGGVSLGISWIKLPVQLKQETCSRTALHTKSGKYLLNKIAGDEA